MYNVRAARTANTTNSKRRNRKKIKEYRTIAIAFLLGLGILFILLVVNRLMAKEALIVQLHNAIFGIDFKKEIQKFLSKEVAVSYSTQFWLGTGVGTERVQFIFFYATDKQKVDVIICLEHFGQGEFHKISIKLDKLPETIYEGDEDMSFEVIPLVSHLKKAREHRFPTANKNVHFLIFSLKESTIETDDKILVQVLINILGGGYL